MKAQGERIGIFGGTFNPPHSGHVRALEHAKDAFQLDRVIVVPAAIPPHKALPSDAASPEDRLEMARLAFSGIPFAEVSEIELLRPGTSYTVDTLWQLHELYDGAVFCLLVGGDMLLSLHMWRAPEEIFTLASVGVLARKKEEYPEIQKHAGFLMERFSALVHIADAPVFDVSSTEIRLRVRSGGNTDGILPEDVRKYIEKRGLYRI